MAAARRIPRQPRRRRPATSHRYTIDASVFVNAFNPHEQGHAASLRILSALQQDGDLVIVPTLLVPEIAAAVARASDDSRGALDYARATAALPHVTLLALTPSMARYLSDAGGSTSRSPC